MGDGATSANDFHAGMNFAAVYKAPVRDDLPEQPVGDLRAAEPSRQVRDHRDEGRLRMACPHDAGRRQRRAGGLPVATKQAAERARRGDGPTFIEAVTYRRLGHSSSDDPTRYRDEAEVKEWEKRDPVDRFRRYLEAEKLWDADKEDGVQEARSPTEVNAAIKQARKRRRDAGRGA